MIGCCARSVSASSTGCTYLLKFLENVNHTKRSRTAESIHGESIQAINSLDFRVSESQNCTWITLPAILLHPQHMTHQRNFPLTYSSSVESSHDCVQALKRCLRRHTIMRGQAVVFRDCKTHISQYTDA